VAGTLGVEVDVARTADFGLIAAAILLLGPPAGFLLTIALDNLDTILEEG
jgi:hypothetical protein